MFRFIKNVFGGIIAFLKGLLSFGKKQPPALDQSSQSTPPADPKPEPQPVAAANNPKPAANSFFLEADEARGFNSPNGGSAPKPQETSQETAQPQVATAKALNLPQPKVTSYNDFSNFGNRRRPGANMSSFLEMARKVRTSS
jgi:hypothetical protein